MTQLADEPGVAEFSAEPIMAHELEDDPAHTPGWDPQRRLFEPFCTTKDVGRGTGLGLYFCMNEIERVGGELTFTSEVGKGTCFWDHTASFHSIEQDRL